MHLSLAVVWRVNGAATPRLLAVRFGAKGTTTNLIVDMLEPERESERGSLGERPPEVVAASSEIAATDRQAGGVQVDDGPPFEDWPVSWMPEDADEENSSESPARVLVGGDDLLPGLLYGESDRPPFDPTSKRRWDDRASNPDRDAILAERARRMVNPGGLTA